VLLLVSLLLLLPGNGPDGEAWARSVGTGGIEVRPLDSQGLWATPGVAYGPYRAGQHPGGPEPDRAELREDLHLIAAHWSRLRVYGATGPTETALQVIRDEGLELRVMLGAWIDAEVRVDTVGRVVEEWPAVRAANGREVAGAIRLAGAYPDIVTAVSVGNETQVTWSAHRQPVRIVIDYLREVRAAVRQPVTTADDFAYWRTPESRELAREVDFITLHAHPLWNGRTLDEALDWTRARLDEVRTMHPDRIVVLGETGWATDMHPAGEQARLIRGRVGQGEQRRFYVALTGWIARTRTPVYVFEAFDEPWKGGDEPDHVEKHWGLFNVDRTPKAAIAEGTR